MTEDEKLSPFEKINIPNIKDFDLIHMGKWANANLYKFDKSGQPMILKSFCFRSLWIRCTVGAFLTHRESTILQRLSGISGIPEKAERCSPTSISYRYMEGETLGSISKQSKKLPESYFLEAEKLIAKMHERQISHLDLRRGENWLVRSDGTPGIIDFQSSISVSFLPKSLKGKLYAIDYSGLYKFWNRLCEKPLDSHRQAKLDSINRMRKFWILKGYAIPGFGKKRTVCKK